MSFFRSITTLIILILFPAVYAASQTPSARMNLTEFVKDPARVEALKRGIAVMKGRKPSDPRSWFFQAAVHGVRADSVQRALAADPTVANVDQSRFWNQCPHRGQPSADFLLWHRAYIYYFERILRDAAGDPTLSLPYWDYSGADRGFPDLLAEPDPDPQTGDPTNPLFDARRELAFVFGLYGLTDRAVSTTPLFREVAFFGQTEESGLAGGVGDTDSSTQGVIEQLPHNSIHFAVGGAIGETAGLMADVDTAALDPVFWIHHANIDRLWTIWECMPSRTWGTVPPKIWLDGKPWSFFDVDLSVKNLPRSFYLIRSSLPVQYDTDNAQCQPLSKNPPVAPDIANPAIMAIAPPKVRLEVGRFENPTILSADRPTTNEITLTTKPIINGKSLMTALATPPVAKPKRIVLNLRGIDYDLPPSVGFDVYINIPDGVTPDPLGPYFAGTLTLFGLKHDGHDASAAAQQLDITSIARTSAFDPSKVRVTIVPFDLFENRVQAGTPLRRSGNLKIASMSVTFVEEGALPTK